MNQTPRTVRAVYIPADSTDAVTTIDLDASPAGLTRAVGGQTGLVLLPGSDAMLYCNENGKAAGLAPNPRATRFVDQYNPGFAGVDMIVGPVVVVGIADDGLEGDVPFDVERLAVLGA